MACSVLQRLAASRGQAAGLSGRPRDPDVRQARDCHTGCLCGDGPTVGWVIGSTPWPQARLVAEVRGTGGEPTDPFWTPHKDPLDMRINLPGLLAPACGGRQSAERQLTRLQKLARVCPKGCACMAHSLAAIPFACHCRCQSCRCCYWLRCFYHPVWTRIELFFAPRVGKGSIVGRSEVVEF